VNEMVEICLCQLRNFDPSRIVVYNADGKQVPCQILNKGTDKPKTLIFPVTLKSGVESTYIVKEGKREKIPPKTNVRFTSERKDDISWENDRIGFRMFGLSSANANFGSVVDVWLKRTSALVLDKWYKDDLSNKASYNEDYGEVLDYYDIKSNTLGAGGLCLYSKDSLWMPRCFNRYKILDNGPLRSSFVLYYDAIPYGSKKLKAELMIILDAGSNLNEAIVMFTGDTTRINVAAGIFMHDSIQSVVGNATQGFIGYAENVFTPDMERVSSGRCYTGVVFSCKVDVTKQVKGHFVGICSYRIGDEYKYFFGAGWSKYGFKNDSDWFRYLSEKRIALNQPLKIKIIK